MGIPLVVGTVVHEAGHALTGVLLGERLRRVEADHRGARVRLRAGQLPRRTVVIVLLAGPAASLALSAAVGAVALAISDELYAWAFGLAAAGNLVQCAVIQLLPVRVGRRGTDGYQLRLAARGTHPDALSVK
jgi:hypothetical protein